MSSQFAEVVFGERGRPLLWSLVGYLVPSMVVTASAAAALGLLPLALYAIAPVFTTVVTTMMHGDRKRQLRAVLLGTVAALLGALSLVTSGSWLLAGLAAAVVFGVTTAMKALPDRVVESDLLSLAFFLGVVVSALGSAGVGDAQGVLRVGLIGVAGGMAGETARLLVARVRRAPRQVTELPPGPSLHSRLRTMSDLRLPEVRFAIVRGLTLGIGVASLSAIGPNRHVAWMLVAVFGVMRPIAGDTIRAAIMRSIATLAGVMVVGFVGSVANAEVTLLASAAALLVGILFLLRSAVPITMASAMLAVAAAGLPGQQFSVWAAYRFVETVTGSVIALAVIFIVMPMLDRVLPVASAESQ